jgi:hypothetical protein
MNGFQLGRMRLPSRFVENLFQIEKSQMRLTRSKRLLLHFRIHETSLLGGFGRGRGVYLPEPFGWKAKLQINLTYLCEVSGQKNSL